jgi:hypothetical protein
MKAFHVISTFALLLTFSIQSAAQRAATGSILYDDDQMFNQLSGAARTLLEARYGKKQGVPQQESVADQTAIGGQFSPQGPLSFLANPLVNDPTADATSKDTQSETGLVLGSGSNVVCSFNDAGSYTGVNNHFTGWSRSTDAGTGWSDLGSLPASTEGDAGDPVFARDKTSGTIYFSTLGFTTGENIQIFRSTNDGATFQAPVNATPGFAGSGDFQDKEWIAVDNFSGTGNGNVYLAWRHFPNFAPGAGITYGIRFTRSTDGGATWIPSQGTLIVGSAGGGVQGAWTCVGPDHSVYVFWLDQTAGAGTAQVIKMRKSTDQGATFAVAVTVATLTVTAGNGDLGLAFRSNSFPQAAVNPISGNIYVVYNNPTAASGGDRGNILFRQSTDGGTTWSSATQLNTDGTTNTQYMPSIAVAPDGGALCVSWYDRRSDPSDALIARWGVTASIVGSVVTFGSNFPISNQFPAVFGVDPVINTTYMGDYDQMDGDDGFFYVTWGDNRDPSIAVPSRKNANVRFAKIPRAGVSPMPVVDFVSAVISGGNGNGKIDFNECNDLTVTLKNDGTASATGVSGTLSTTTSGVTITQNVSVYPDLAAGASAANSTAFKISTDPGFACGTTVLLTLTVNYAGGSDAHNFTFPSCLCADTVIVGSIVSGDLQQTARLFRDAVASNCSSPKGSCPGTSGSGTRSFDAYTFTNSATSTACVTATLTPNCSVANFIFAVAYTGSFVSSDVCTNYLADLGSSPGNGSSLSFGFNIPALGTVVVVVNEVTAATGCSSYTLRLSGLLSSTDGGGACAPLPIQLASFTGRATSDTTVLLEWRTLSEVNNYGFEMQKSPQQMGLFTTIPGSFVPGHGTTLVPQYYQFTDVNATPYARYYRLRQIDLDGSIHYSDAIHVGTLTGIEGKQIPTEFLLAQNYPNPFNPSTIINYGLPTGSRVTLEVFNILGQRVALLANNVMEAGYHHALFDGKGLSSGVYFYKLTAGSFVDSKKLLLMR